MIFIIPGILLLGLLLLLEASESAAVQLLILELLQRVQP